MTSLVKSPDPEALSHAIRESNDPYMRRRRQVVTLSMLSAACMSVIALYQIGVTKHVPEPPLPGLDADAVDASGHAYEKLSVGDAFLGFVSYGVTMLLAAMGGPGRYRSHPYVPLALAGKAACDAGQAATLTRDQWVRHRAFCSWCLTAATATFAVVPLVVPEALAAYRSLSTRR
jgi:hypothetical protein